MIWSQRHGYDANINLHAGWGKYMEWQYPVTVEVTNSAAFKAAGAVEAAASL